MTFTLILASSGAVVFMLMFLFALIKDGREAQPQRAVQVTRATVRQGLPVAEPSEHDACVDHAA